MVQGRFRLKTTVEGLASRKAKAKAEPKAPAKGSPKSEPVISEKSLAKVTEIFGLLSDPSRLKILLALARDGELHVSALCGQLAQSQPAVSHHLTLLRLSHLVAFRRSGKYNFYRLDSAALSDLLDQVFEGNSDKIPVGDYILSLKKK
jgi:ArsR family transcriptional regulator